MGTTVVPANHHGSSAGLQCRIRIDEKAKNWCRRGESNPRPRDYETLALPLSYAGMRPPFMLRIRLQRCQGVLRPLQIGPRRTGRGRAKRM